MKISVIVPVYNEEKKIKTCLDSIINQNYPKKDYELIVVNDGSTDKTNENIKEIIKFNHSIKIKLINQENKGRLVARKIGADNARYENILFIDSRCVADSYALKNASKINEEVIIGNPLIEDNNWFAKVNILFRKKIYGKEFNTREFSPIYVDLKNFDDIPKGTTVLFCNKKLFLKSQHIDITNKLRSDDTAILYNMVKNGGRVVKHPKLVVTYTPRYNVKPFFKHIYERGPRFVDYYLEPGKKYFSHLISFIIITLLFLISLVILPKSIIIWIFSFLLINIFASIWLSKSFKDFPATFFILPLFEISFSLGVLKGLILKLIKFY